MSLHSRDMEKGLNGSFCKKKKSYILLIVLLLLSTFFVPFIPLLPCTPPSSIPPLVHIHGLYI